MQKNQNVTCRTALCIYYDKKDERLYKISTSYNISKGNSSVLFPSIVQFTCKQIPVKNRFFPRRYINFLFIPVDIRINFFFKKNYRIFSNRVSFAVKSKHNINQTSAYLRPSFGFKSFDVIDCASKPFIKISQMNGNVSRIYLFISSIIPFYKTIIRPYKYARIAYMFIHNYYLSAMR